MKIYLGLKKNLMNYLNLGDIIYVKNINKE